MGFIPDNSSSSSDLTLRSSTDCQIVNPTNNQCLVYDGTLWKNQNLNIEKTLNDLTDVTITTPSENQTIKYTSGGWVNAPSSELDCDVSTKAPWNLLMYGNNNKWINTDSIYVDSITTKTASVYSDYAHTIGQDAFIGDGTSLSPAFYNYDTTYTSIAIDASFVSHVSSYFIKLPTTLANGSVIYIQVTSVGAQEIGMRGGATPQDDLFIGVNNRIGYLYADVPKTYKLTYYTPSSNNPRYGDTNYTANSWMVETDYNYIPLSSSVTVHNIDTTHTGGQYRLPRLMNVGQLVIVKDVSGHAQSHNITLVLDSNIKIDGSSTNYVLSSNFEALMLICKIGSSMNSTEYHKINSSSTAVSATSLSSLTDCSVSSPSNDQVLVFTTASSLNKWTPYTISGATFNDTNKTITISGTTALSGLTTDVTISTPANGNLLMYNGSKWVNTDSIPDNLFFVKDDGDGTKKLQFQLSNITSGQTRTLTVPDASCVIVGDTNTQTLTHKTLTDDTNTIRANSLKSATTTVDVASATAPTIGQVLTATGATGASWQTLTHSTLSDVALENIDNNHILIFNSGKNKWINTLSSSLPSAFGIIVKTFGGGSGGTGIANNAYFTQSQYADNSDSTMFINYDLVVARTTLSQFNYSSNINGGQYSLLADPPGTWLFTTGPTKYSTPMRFNVDHGSSMKMVAFKYGGIHTNCTNWSFNVYGSNSSSSYNDLNYSSMTTDTNITLLYSVAYTSTPFTAPYLQVDSLDPTNLYRYLHIFINPINGSVFLNGFSSYSGSLTITNLVGGTHYNVSSDATSGFPRIQNIRGSNIQGYHNTFAILQNEMFRRIYPVIRDTNTIILTDGGSNTKTLTSTSIPATGLNAVVVSATAPSSGQILTATGATGASWQTPANASSLNTVIVSASAPSSGQILTATGSIGASWQTPANASSLNTVVVSATAPTTGQVLTATGSTGASWQTPATGVTTLTSMTDVSITNATNQNLLAYDLTLNKWINKSQALISTYIISIVLTNDFSPVEASYHFNATNTIDAYVVDMQNITQNAYSFYLPVGFANRQQISVLCNDNINANPTPLLIAPTLNNGLIFTSEGNSATSINGTRNNTYTFTYYTSNNPWNTTSATYPNWTCTTSSYIPIPKNISLVCFNSRLPAPSPTFNVFISIDLDNKEYLQILDTGGVASGCKLYVYRNSTSFTFMPESSAYVAIETNGQNWKIINILGNVINF